MHSNCQAAVPAMGVCLLTECPCPGECMVCTECECKEYECQCDRDFEISAEDKHILEQMNGTPDQEFEDIPF